MSQLPSEGRRFTNALWVRDPNACASTITNTKRTTMNGMNRLLSVSSDKKTYEVNVTMIDSSIDDLDVF